MKRLIYILTVLSFLSIQCTKEEVSSDGKETYVVFNVTQPEATITKTTITKGMGYHSVKWSDGDILYVFGKDKGYLGTVSLSSGAGTSSGTFAGTITLPSSAQLLHLYYFGKNNTPAMTAKTTTYSFDISSQTGKLEDIENNFHLMHGVTSGKIPSTQSEPISVTMSSKISIALFDLTSQSGFTGSEITCEGAYNSGKLYLKTNKWENSSKEEQRKVGDITLKNPTSSYYMVLISETDCLTFTDGNRWINKDPSSSVEESVFYSTDNTGTVPIAVKWEAKDYPSSIAKIGDAVRIGDTWWAPVNCGYDSSHPYGLLYQWGRSVGCGYNAAPFQENAAGPIATEPEDGKFYITSGNEWYSGTHFEVWPTSFSTGIADPCPSGWRLPTSEEVNTLVACAAKWKTDVGIYGHGSGSCRGTMVNGVLFFPAAGGRVYSSGAFVYKDNLGYYWSSCHHFGYGFADASDPSFTNSAEMNSGGESVRCVCSVTP